MRTAVINPGSSSWWLLTLSPFLYYEKIRISPDDIESIKSQEDLSTYNFWVSRILEDLNHYAGPDFIILDSGLPGRGLSSTISFKIDEISNYLIEAADSWTPHNPTIVRPGELKNVMLNAYKEWIRYSKYKLKILQKEEPLYNELALKQIPESKKNLSLVKNTHAKRIPELLENRPKLKSVFKEIIRNAFLLVTVTDKPNERVYDVLSSEYLPAVELVERFRIFVELQKEISEPTSIRTLLYLYNLQMKRAISTASNKPIPPEKIVIQAIKERERFSILRKRLSELEILIQDYLVDREDTWIKEILDVAKALNKDIERIDRLGKPLLWASKTYVFMEVLSHIEEDIKRLIKLLVVNPYTTRAAIEGIKNLYLSKKGISGQASAIIAVARDFIGARSVWTERGPAIFGPGTFKFWV